MAGIGEEPTIGIDLGTMYSCVGVWLCDCIEIIMYDHGKRSPPSCVAFTDTQRLIGNAAFNQAGRNPHNTVFRMKKHLTFTNDVERYTKKELRRLVQEAEKYNAEDKEYKNKLESRYAIKYSMYKLEVRKKKIAEAMKKTQEALDMGYQCLDWSQFVKLEEVEEIRN